MSAEAYSLAELRDLGVRSMLTFCEACRRATFPAVAEVIAKAGDDSLTPADLQARSRCEGCGARGAVRFERDDPLAAGVVGYWG